MFDDPLFKDSGFGSIDKMFKDAKSLMKSEGSFGDGNGHYFKQSYVMSEKRGADG